VVKHHPEKLGEKMSANDTQISGNHYKDKPVQVWDFVAANNLGYFEGNIVKYVSRWKDKGGVDDLRKAKHYIEKLIELETQVKDESKTIHGFIPWAGGKQPVCDGVMVEVLFGDQEKLQGLAVTWSWRHDSDMDANIIGYRVIK
jgi:hypothetical protein